LRKIGCQKGLPHAADGFAAEHGSDAFDDYCGIEVALKGDLSDGVAVEAGDAVFGLGEDLGVDGIGDVDWRRCRGHDRDPEQGVQKGIIADGCQKREVWTGDGFLRLRGMGAVPLRGQSRLRFIAAYCTFGGCRGMLGLHREGWCFMC
jgi:hypothetical protein